MNKWMYNISTANYSSYPAVPYWSESPVSDAKWKRTIKQVFDKTNEKEGIYLYIHLPFCEELCTFCGFGPHITKNHSIETVYIDYLLKEWKLYLHTFKAKPNIKGIYIGGGTPTFFSPDNLKYLLSVIMMNAHVAKDADLCIEAHVNNTNAYHLGELTRLGFKRISFGIQDFDSQVQEKIKRKQTFERVSKVTQEARYLGFNSINYDLIYGLPLQSRKTIIDTIYKIRQLKPDRVSLYEYRHNPHTSPAQRKFENVLPVDPEKMNLYEISREMLLDSGYFEIGMDHFVLKTDPLYQAFKDRHLHRNMMGYTTSQTSLMIGMGVMAISDGWYGFSSNERRLKQYFHLLDRDILPIEKSHYLSTDDFMLRKHILDIQCRYETKWDAQIEKTPALYKAIQRLKTFEKDKLIKIDENGIKVKKAGKPYIRNICSALDERLWRDETDSMQF